jgi:hypothetical protein
MVTQDQPSMSNYSYVLMCTTDKDKEISLTTQAKDYLYSNGSAIDHPSKSPPPPYVPLQIDKPGPDIVIGPPTKGVISKLSFNCMHELLKTTILYKI